MQESLPTQTDSAAAALGGRDGVPLDAKFNARTANQDLERAISRVRRRLLSVLLLLYIISFLDRANIGFAKQALQTYVGISPEAFAMAAGLFFVSYSFSGFPSNLILHRIGARIWMSSIMVVWGAVSMSTMFVRGSASLYTLRLLLGVAEAGFFPGVILYLTYWFPNRIRGQMMGLFYLGVPFSLVFGSPLSGFLLGMHPIRPFQNWQWMFLIEGFLAVAAGFASYWYLDNKPVDAAWLPEGEKQALIARLAREENERRASGPSSLLPMLRNPRVLQFALIYTLIQICVYGAVFYLPTEVSELLHQPAGLQVGVISAIPWICASFAVWWLPQIADRLNLHRSLASVAMLISGVASFVFPVSGPLVGLIALSITVSGIIAAQPIFWTFPTDYLAGRAAAGGIAVVTLGNLGGFFGPYMKVWADDRFHSPTAGLYLLAGLTVLNAGMIALVRARRYSDQP
ncbi:MAG TPA: MFS transporter [Terracidiphilus sp.]|nr:MFS transporter [Terracidiphilus sp.]